MQLVLVVHGQLIAHILRIVAGVLTAGLSEAGFRRAQIGTGTAEVHVHLVGQFVEDFFQLDGLGAQQHDVARGTVHVGQAGTAQIPDVAQVAQELGVIVFARGLGHTHGVEVGHAGELFGLVAVPADNAAAVTEHAHDAAVFPVGFLVVVGKLQHAQQVFGAVRRDLIVKTLGIFGPRGRFLFDVGHKARPGAAFKLVQLGGCIFRHCHTSTWFGCITPSRDMPFRCADPGASQNGLLRVCRCAAGAHPAPVPPATSRKAAAAPAPQKRNAPRDHERAGEPKPRPLGPQRGLFVAYRIFPLMTTGGVEH